MREAFYFELFKRTNNELFSRFMSLLAQWSTFCIYKIKLKGTKDKTNITMSPQQAMAHLESIYPFGDESAEIINPPESGVKCSIIVPVYNHEDIIVDRLDRIVYQQCDYSYEVIIVDDGSNDETKRCIQKYYDNPICKIITQDNQGIGAARNTGLNVASGKYVMFVDCDDIVDSTVLQGMISKAETTNCDIVVCGYQLEKEKSGKIYDTKKYVYPKWLLKTYTDENDIMSLPGYPWGKIIKRTIFEDIRFIPGYWYEDSIMHFLVYRKAKSFKYVPSILYHYKWYEKNFSKVQNSKANPRGVQRYWMLKRMINESDRIGLPRDVTFYITLLRHLGVYYYGNLKDFDITTREAMFVLAVKLLKDNYIKVNRLSKMERELEKALLTSDYKAWELACKYY